MTRTHALAVIAGLLAMAVSQYSASHLGGSLLGIFPGESAVFYVMSVLQIVSAFLYVAPGFVAGFIARKHGIASGFVTGLLGGGINAVLVKEYWAAGHVSANAMLVVLTAGIVTGVSLAAAGGAAELLRSNSRWSGP